MRTETIAMDGALKALHDYDDPVDYGKIAGCIVVIQYRDGSVGVLPFGQSKERTTRSLQYALFESKATRPGSRFTTG